MSDCWQCKASVPPNAEQCPECGAAQLRDVSLATEQDEPKKVIHSLLMNAFLLKMRGDLEAAGQECIRALRVNPDNVDAHSLLGDVYREQGRAEDAADWYKMAVDLNPDSEADRAKLEQVSPKQEAQEASEEARRPDAAARRTKWIAIGAAALVLQVLVVLVTWQLSIRLSHQQADVPSPAEAPPLAAPQNTPPTQTPPSAPAETPTAPATSQSPVAHQEKALMEQLNASAALTSRGLGVSAVSIDPAHASATITFSSPRPEGEDAVGTLVRNSIVVAREAFLRDKALSSVATKAQYSMPSDGGARPQIALMTESRRESALQVDPEKTPYAEQLAALESVWWQAPVRPERRVGPSPRPPFQRRDDEERTHRGSPEPPTR